MQIIPNKLVFATVKKINKISRMIFWFCKIYFNGASFIDT